MAAMLTTEDNPHDPRLDFKAWYLWDLEHGYNTCAYLDRVALVPEGYPEYIEQMLIDEAIDIIIELHAGGLYKKLPIDEAA